jgi:DNA-binding CsgD family transcriptional regulator
MDRTVMRQPVKKSGLAKTKHPVSDRTVGHILKVYGRTKVGLDAARREGRIGGRRPKLTSQQQTEIIKMLSKGYKTAAETARLFKIHPATVSQLLARTNTK